jgi:membrane protein DedA with SNARE-associated domain
MFDSLLASLEALQGAPAYALVFAALAATGFGLPVNEDLLLLAAAALTLRGVMEPVPLAVVAWCGILVADTLVFHWGHRFGARLLRTGVLFAAGSLKLRHRDLWLYDGLAGAVEIPLLVFTVRAVGGQWQAVVEQLQRWQSVLVPAALALVGVAVAWTLLRRRRRGRAG